MGKQAFTPVGINEYRYEYEVDKIKRLEKQLAKLKGAG